MRPGGGKMYRLRMSQHHRVAFIGYWGGVEIVVDHKGVIAPKVLPCLVISQDFHDSKPIADCQHLVLYTQTRLRRKHWETRWKLLWHDFYALQHCSTSLCLTQGLASFKSKSLTSRSIPRTVRPPWIPALFAGLTSRPSDKHASMSLPPSKIIGCDFSGEVSALGSEVPFNSFSVGDRVAGVVHGCKDSHTGAFAETLVADANMCFKLPSTATKDSDLEAACTLGVGWISAAQALRQRLYKDEKTSSSREDTVSLILKSRRGNKRRNVDSNCSFSYTQPPPIQACMQYSKPASTFPLPIS